MIVGETSHLVLNFACTHVYPNIHTIHGMLVNCTLIVHPIVGVYIVGIRDIPWVSPSLHSATATCIILL